MEVIATTIRDEVEGTVFQTDLEAAIELSIEPFFFKPSAAPTIMHLTVRHEDKVIQRADLVLSGTTGQLRLIDRSQPCQPAFVTGGPTICEEDANGEPANPQA
jgi:hypothetical protein